MTEIYTDEDEEMFIHFYGDPPYALVNDKGFYFEKFNEKLYPERLIKYPTYNWLLENIKNIIEEDKIVFLYPTQKKEIELLKVYMPIHKTPFIMERLYEYIGLSKRYSDSEIIHNAKTLENRYDWLLLYIFPKICKKYNLNPSYLINNCQIRDAWKLYDLSMIEEPQAKKYIHSNNFFEPYIFAELIFSDLIKEETPQSKALNKLLEKKEGERFTSQEIELPKQLEETLMEIGYIYKPEIEYLART